MAERAVNAAALLSQEKPLIKIGHYVLGETLGVGTFGKVKSKGALPPPPPNPSVWVLLE